VCEQCTGTYFLEHQDFKALTVRVSNAMVAIFETSFTALLSYILPSRFWNLDPNW
jgi:hypothetical protein